MDMEVRLRQMLELATKHAQELMKEKHAIGAVLFGSAAQGDVNEESDVDLAVIYNTVAADIQVGKEEKRIGDVRVEVWRYPITPFIETFENEKLRNKPDTWMWTSLWIECMQTGLLLADPTGRLAKWKAKAKEWKWRDNEIQPAAKEAESNLHVSERFLVEQKPFEALICLREALTCLSAAHVMRHGLIPSFRPKEISSKLHLINDKENSLVSVFDLVNDSAELNYNLVEGLLHRLKEFVDAEWGMKQIGPRTEFENARSCLLRKDFLGAMLSLRYSAYWLGFHIINKRSAKLKAEICSGENHVEMVNQLVTAQRSFYDFYKQLQFVEKWDSGQVEVAINGTKKVLDDWRVSAI
jgi:predicted nucleotidyltransferase